jgi:hypothetical protein
MADKTPFFRLFERISKNGTPYLSGRLGDMKLVAFRETDLDEADLYGARARGTVYAAPADQTQRPAVQARERPPLKGVAYSRTEN